MKNKFLSFILSIVMLVGVGSLASCKESKPTPVTPTADVQLVSVEGTAHEEIQGPKERKRLAPIVLAADDTDIDVDTEVSENTEETTEEIEETTIDTLGYNVLILPTSATEYDVTINLDNQADHSIQDFRLTSTDETLKMYNENQDRWDLIDTTKSIKWLGANNSSFRFTLQTESEESATSIKITEILYLNRNTEKVENVNLSTGPDYVDVVKADMPKINLEDIYYDADKYIEMKYSVDWNGVSNVKIGDTEIEKGKSYYSRYGTDAKLTWEIPYKDTNMLGSYERPLFANELKELLPFTSYVAYFEANSDSVDSIHLYVVAEKNLGILFNFDWIIKINGKEVNLNPISVNVNNNADSIIVYDFIGFIKDEDILSSWSDDDDISVYILNNSSYIYWYTNMN